MDTRTAATETQHPYPVTSSWTSPAAAAATATATASNAASSATPLNTTVHAADGSQDVAAAAAAQFPSHIDFFPFLYPQQSTLYHAQLLHYNKLISPTRGGGLQSSTLPQVASSPHIQPGPRSRSSSKASLKDGTNGKSNAAGGHGGRSHQNSDKTRPVITSKEAPPRISGKTEHVKIPLHRSTTSPALHTQAMSQSQGQAQPAASVPSHPQNQGQKQSQHQIQNAKAHNQNHAQTQIQNQSHSSSVPSTPQQHARQFSFESREPSPTAGNNHSPRSAYSETNGTLPSLRPLPPRLGGCKFETSQINSRRRIPYSVGSDRLEKVELQTVKSKLSEDEEKKLATDMREIFDRLIPTEKVEKNRKRLVEKLEKIFNDEWPGHDIKVHLFGSSGNLLCSDDSDVDICITTPWRELEGVCMIANLLAKRGMEKVVCISAAKVPIVKIWDPELQLACDMNVNNTLALENTRMVRTYVETDPRVRQLAMIIKYWTRRRIVNDAAFGGTLSSYTWICLIIAFLQLRSPPVLPALHQLPYKMPKKDGTVGDFADNLKKLRGYGNKNKASEAELLFQFFRFYAHEFDYDKNVLSVRQGKLVTKTEKKWNYAINNQLCVEEPFNTSRNLGNTADEYSFRGLHIELRRAFDLISEAKLEEACELYVFPKEEERVWSRPAPQPRPVLLRSSSQTHSGRGGRGNHRGGRHNNNNNAHRGGGPNRRASSSVPTYETNMFIPTLGMQQDMWYQNPQFQFQYAQQDLMTQMAYHHESMRQLHMYAQAQSPAFHNHQGLGQQPQQQPQTQSQSQQPQSQQPQRVASTPGSVPQTSTDRSRTNSFDNPPLSAPLRPDLYTLYGMTLGQQFYQQAATGYGTYPSSPAATPTSQEYRRPLQRSTVTTDSGASASSSTLRSQSQPASRTPTTQNPPMTYTMGSQAAASAPVFVPRHHGVVPIPSFMPDDVDFDEAAKAVSDSPHSDEGMHTIPMLDPVVAAAQMAAANQAALPVNAVPANPVAFGDTSGQSNGARSSSQSSGPGRRRLSTDQLPQTILDRRMRRTSRSPSPMGHARAFSAGTSTAPTSAPFPAGHASSRPLVVNGSGLKTSITASPQRSTYATSMGPDEVGALPSDTTSGLSGSGYLTDMSAQSTREVSPQLPPQISTDHPPVVVNGTTLPTPSQLQPADDASFRERIALLSSWHAAVQGQQDMTNGMTSRLSPSARQRLLNRQNQNPVIAPLDLAETRMERPVGPELALSPVYETRSPSPTVVRRFDSLSKQAHVNAASTSDNKPSAESPTTPTSKPEGTAQPSQSPRAQAPQEGGKSQKAQKQAPSVSKTLPVGRENGHVRGAKSESDGWQKAGKGKKKGANGAAQQSQAEQPPKHESERKGG